MEIKKDHTEFPIGFLVLEEPSASSRVRSFVQKQSAPCDGDDDFQDMVLGGIPFYVGSKDSILVAVKKNEIPCPCIWAEEENIHDHAAILHVAYDFGLGVQSAPLLLRPVKVEQRCNESASNRHGSLHSMCSGTIKKNLYMQLYRLVHILFPTLNCWKQDLLEHRSIIVDQAEFIPEENDIVLAEGHGNSLLLRNRHQSLSVSPNFLLGCLEARLGAVKLVETEDSSCLRAVRYLEEALSMLKGEKGNLESALITPLSSPEKKRQIFSSPAKEPISKAGKLNVAEAVASIFTCNSFEVKDGTSYIQTICNNIDLVRSAVHQGIFKALVSAASSMLGSSSIGHTEQLTMLTLTCSMLLDSMAESQRAQACRDLMSELKNALEIPCANPNLLLHFMLALVQRADLKAEAINQNLAGTLSRIYVSKCPLLEPLAMVLTSSRNRDGTLISSGSSEEYGVTEDVQSSKSRSRVVGRNNIPLLSLGTIQEPIEDAGILHSASGAGLTRATRRERKNSARWTPSGSESPSLDFSMDNSSHYQMKYLARALGESLVARDLPAVIAQRRTEISDDSLEEPVSGTRDRVSSFLRASSGNLKAHKLLSTSSSNDTLSIESESVTVSNPSISGNSQGCSDDNFGSESSEDWHDLKSLLIEGICACSNPITGVLYLNPDPSAIISADVLSFPIPLYESSAYISRCLTLLAKTSRSNEQQHRFLIAVGNKLQSITSRNVAIDDIEGASVSYYLRLAAEYVALCKTSSAATSVSNTCLGVTRIILKSFAELQFPIWEWSKSALYLLGSVFQLLEPCLTLCQDTQTGQSFILLLLGEVKIANLLMKLARETLLNELEMDTTEQSHEIAQAEKDLLSLLVALSSLIGRQPNVHNVERRGSEDVICIENCSRTRRALSRSNCLHFFAFLVSPGNSLVHEALEGEEEATIIETKGSKEKRYSLSSRSVRLRNGVFGLLKSLFSARNSPFIADRGLTDYYVRFHFIRFLKLYHNPTKDHQAIFLCRQHLSMLCTLAAASKSSRNLSIQSRFQHLSVVEFFVKEFGLEFEATQVLHRRHHGKSEGSMDSSNEKAENPAQSSILFSEAVNNFQSEDLTDQYHENQKPSVPRLVLKDETGTGTSYLSKDSIKPKLSLSLQSMNRNETNTGQVLPMEKSPAVSAMFSPTPKIPTAHTNQVLTEDMHAATKPLERFTSAAISLDAIWNTSGTVKAESEIDTSISGTNSDSLSSEDVQVSLPSNFGFTGDLDEDVARLEALEITQKPETFQDAINEEAVSPNEPLFSELTPWRPRHGIPKLDMPTKAAVPKLVLPPSALKSYHKRTDSAELRHVAEQEVEMRKAGRSFFGDMERQALDHGKMHAVRYSGNLNVHKSSYLSAVRSSHNISVDIEGERAHRLLYCDDELHVLAIQLIFTLIIDCNGDLDPRYCDRYPWDHKMQNIPFILHHHLNDEAIVDLLPRIMASLHELGKPAVRLLRILCADFFRPDWYQKRSRISGVAGAYSTVFKCCLPWWGQNEGLVLKVIDAPKHNTDRCSQVEFFSEVAIHEALRSYPGACRMLDYGLDMQADAFILVLVEYKCSLKQWRAKQKLSNELQLPVYWMIFREIIRTCVDLLDRGIVHFDLKCDNVLLEPCAAAPTEAFWKGVFHTSSRKYGNLLLRRKHSRIRDLQLAFNVILGDFGESVKFEGGKEGAQAGSTMHARGTDSFKSPEMLLVGGASQVHHRAFDRRKQRGAGAPSDVWSLGCLLYELVTGVPLFIDNDWMQLVARVTSPGSQLITDDRKALIEDLPGVLDMLNFLLVRNPNLRPTLDDALTKVEEIIAGSNFNFQVGSCDSFSEVEEGTSSESSKHFESLSQSQYVSPLNYVLRFSPAIAIGSVRSICQRGHSNERKSEQILLLSSHCMIYEVHWKQEAILSPPLHRILGDDDLISALEELNADNLNPPHVLCCPGDLASSTTLMQWAKQVAAIRVKDSNGRTQMLSETDIVISSHYMDHVAAFLAVAFAVLQTKSLHGAMVSASHCGIDRYLQQPVFLQALLMLERE